MNFSFNEVVFFSKDSTTEKFIKQAKELNGDQYDYAKVNYINNKTKIIIICKEHGEFFYNLSFSFYISPQIYQ